MTIFGKSLSEYVCFQKYVLLLIAIVGLGRLALSLNGVPDASIKWLSATIASIIGLLYVAITVHTTGFGSYKHLLPLLFLQNALVNLIAAAAIALAIGTGQDNIFSSPEYSGGVDGKTWGHVGAHLIAGFIILPLVAWLLGSLILFVTKKVAPGKGQAAGAGA